MPSDQMHDMLISMCTQEQRLEEAVDLVKRLARRPPGAAAGGAAGAATGAGAGAAAAAAGGSGSPPSSPRAGTGSAPPGGLQEHTLNSLIRALCGKYPDRALRLLSLCQVRDRHGNMHRRSSCRTRRLCCCGCMGCCGCSGAASSSSGWNSSWPLSALPSSSAGTQRWHPTPPIQTMGMRTGRRTYLALITGCARASRSAVAYDLYRSRECLPVLAGGT